jgi:hypothetical protein
MMRTTALTAVLLAATVIGQQPQAPSSADDVRARYT